MTAGRLPALDGLRGLAILALVAAITVTNSAVPPPNPAASATLRRTGWCVASLESDRRAVGSGLRPPGGDGSKGRNRSCAHVSFF